jgi:hypothetical protein
VVFFVVVPDISPFYFPQGRPLLEMCQQDVLVMPRPQEIKVEQKPSARDRNVEKERTKKRAAAPLHIVKHRQYESGTLFFFFFFFW